MDLEQKIMEQLKTAMKEKNQVALASLRAVKSAILMEKTAGSDSTLSEADEIKILQRQIKQRKEAAEQFIASGAMEMAEEEMAQAAVIEQFLPVQLTEDEVIGIVKK